MNSVVQRINGQFSVAKEKFPELKQLSQYEFEIKFADFPNSKYRITLPPNYPESAPTIKENKEVISTELTTNWLYPIQLYHVIQQLQVRTKYFPGPAKKISEKDIKSTLSESKKKLTDDEERQSIINRLPQVVEANEKLKRMQKKVQDSQEEADKMLTTMVEAAERIRHLNEERKIVTSKILAAKASGPEKLIEAKKIKIGLLNQNAIDINAEIEQLKQKLAKNEINIKEFLKQVECLKEKQLFDKFLAEELEKL